MKKNLHIFIILLGLCLGGSVFAKKFDIRTGNRDFTNIIEQLNSHYTDLEYLEQKILLLTENAYLNSLHADNTSELSMSEQHQLTLRNKIRSYKKHILKFSGKIRKDLDDKNHGVLDVIYLVKNFNKIVKFHKAYEKYMDWSDIELNHQKLPKTVQKNLIALKYEFQDFIDLKKEYELYNRPAVKAPLTFRSAQQACYTLTSPGEIILKHALMTEGTTDDDFGPRTMFFIKLKEAFSFHNLDLSYRHAELITNLENPNNIETISFYPHIFNKNKPEEEKKPNYLIMNNKDPEYKLFRMSYSVFRVKSKNARQNRTRRENAFKKVKDKKKYAQLGVCSDFINWLFDNQITSNWNFIPVIKQFIQVLYLPEGIQTPDNLADSYMTEMVCDIKDQELLYPKRVDVHAWIKRLKEDRTSTNNVIKNHAEKIIKDLERNKIIDLNGKPLVDMAEINMKEWSFIN